MGLLDFFKNTKKEEQPKKERPFEGSWDADTLADDKRQAESVAAKQYHVVQDGESLSKIAEKYYNDANRWQVIHDANQEEIENPDLIHPGQRLYIPEIGEPQS
uniref:LysM peptidoglycan-binding domain-containing protein n=1 Tax=Roseihalotalea indica TaxID=2867963 RepID=A0AA49GPN4_9BACT|nr:LysM peptidoglycan-binding domain-containing protein [Tunicatimonas sp. TK19036]